VSEGVDGVGLGNGRFKMVSFFGLRFGGDKKKSQ
jgi:hypothetical protein